MRSHRYRMLMGDYIGNVAMMQLAACYARASEKVGMRARECHPTHTHTRLICVSLERHGRDVVASMRGKCIVNMIAACVCVCVQCKVCVSMHACVRCVCAKYVLSADRMRHAESRRRRYAIASHARTTTPHFTRTHKNIL